MATSAVPGAITALLTILRASDQLEDVTVIDGPPTDDVATEDLLVVGWSPQGEAAAELVQNFNAAGARTRDEDFNLTCYIDCWSGDFDFADVRGRVFQILGVVEQELRATSSDPTAPNLNGAVMWAHLTRGVLQQSTNDKGIRAGLAFTLSCHARL
ncbi:MULTISPECIES: hypothetical protein [Streptomyces]|uniref:hypothetical protein n=1 Tax=Streptomyces TaxID=1883 RepID=UPI0029A1380C|nr:hypothetical protein [Streptomyces stelliscabiei]MDX2520591.1 hypothetical protein [Streptomyces stelliscabiei]MDX2552688.1 hypothetical protein [Streptomyces stelliscabiei]MDX2661372.1 hypothetical protein [Streptomyces stelliscabiei]MDX2788853.1 hypothetical protein [Streptomyces stelliscabiei]